MLLRSYHHQPHRRSMHPGGRSRTRTQHSCHGGRPPLCRSLSVSLSLLALAKKTLASRALLYPSSAPCARAISFSRSRSLTRALSSPSASLVAAASLSSRALQRQGVVREEEETMRQSAPTAAVRLSSLLALAACCRKHRPRDAVVLPTCPLSCPKRTAHSTRNFRISLITK